MTRDDAFQTVNRIDHALKEVEKEITAYIVAKRNKITPMSESYLANYKHAFKNLNLYGIMHAANAVETAMGISAKRSGTMRHN